MIHNSYTASSFANQLTVNLKAVVANWQQLAARGKGASCAAVVKADAYGLGAIPIAKALAAAGCQEFFVASLEEGHSLRAAIGKAADIYVLNGLVGGGIDDFLAEDLRPVLNTLGQVERWQKQANQAPCAVMLDTGMTRLGVGANELSALLEKLRSLNLVLVLSHLACADDPNAAKNAVQLQQFNHCLELLKPRYPGLRVSLSSTAGIALGEGYHFDLLRPGVGLYGASPDPSNAWPWLESVVELRLPVIQVRTLSQEATVGYGASQAIAGGRTLATVYGGYADGMMRSMAGKGFGYLSGIRVPMVGRVSMDYGVFDITDAVPSLVDGEQELQIEMLGSHQTVDELALQFGTIGYEVLTSIGRRYQRRYV